MSLPILNIPAEPSRADLLRFFHRTALHRAQEVAEVVELDVGRALTNPDLAEDPEANHVRDAALPEGMSPREAVELIEAHFAAAGTTCGYWVMNPAAPASQTVSLAAYLMAHGHSAVTTQVMRLRRAYAPPAADTGSWRIIPARASYRHARELARLAENDTGQSPAAAVLRLDDPHRDALLALRDGEAAAGVGVLAAGDLGRIDELYVSPKFRRQGVGRALLWRTLEICARASFKHIFAEVAPKNAAAVTLLQAGGFQVVGEVVAYRK